MSLPILQSSSTSDPERLLRLYSQALMELARPLGKETAVDTGIAIAGDGYDLHISPGLDAKQSIDELLLAMNRTERAERRIFLKPGLPDHDVSQLNNQLEDNGYHPTPQSLYQLRKMPFLDLATDVQVISARAGHKLAEELANEIHNHDWITRLDDPRYECLLLLKNKTAAGKIGILSMGDVGIIDTPIVSTQFRNQGLATQLMAHTFDLCSRSTFKHVLTSTPSNCTTGNNLFTKFGFEKIGQIDMYQLPKHR